jgi:hypothetical protein
MYRSTQHYDNNKPPEKGLPNKAYETSKFTTTTVLTVSRVYRASGSSKAAEEARTRAASTERTKEMIGAIG